MGHLFVTVGRCCAAIDCGLTNDSTGGGPGVFYYACDPQRWSADGVVYNLNLAETQTVDLDLMAGTELDLFIMDGCDEQSCFMGPFDSASLLLGGRVDRVLTPERFARMRTST